MSNIGSETPMRSRMAIDRLIACREVALREKALYRMPYETAARAEDVLELNIEDLDLAGPRAAMTAKDARAKTRRRGQAREDVALETVYWDAGRARLLPRLLKGRARGPVFMPHHRPGPGKDAVRILARYRDVRAPRPPTSDPADPVRYELRMISLRVPATLRLAVATGEMGRDAWVRISVCAAALPSACRHPLWSRGPSWSPRCPGAASEPLVGRRRTGFSPGLCGVRRTRGWLS
nr:hypothetical protein [Actinopolyspora halophila]